MVCEILVMRSLVVWLVVGCGAHESLPDASSNQFDFEVFVALSDDVTRVTVDGFEQTPVQDGTGRALLFIEGHFSYPIAIASAAKTIEFWSGATSLARGMARPGVCGMDCTTDTCPTSSTIRRERVQFQLTNFAPEEYDCFQCEDSEHLIFRCP